MTPSRAEKSMDLDASTRAEEYGVSAVRACKERQAELLVELEAVRAERDALQQKVTSKGLCQAGVSQREREAVEAGVRAMEAAQESLALKEQLGGREKALAETEACLHAEQARNGRLE